MSRYLFFAATAASAAATLLKMPQSLSSDIIDYLPPDERLAIIRDMLPFFSDQVGEQLRVAGGFATVTEALDDFIKYNRPELIEASSGMLDLDDMRKTHLRRNMGVVEFRTVPEWLSGVVNRYLWCLGQEFCKYLPTGLRNEEGVAFIRPVSAIYPNPVTSTTPLWLYQEGCILVVIPERLAVMRTPAKMWSIELWEADSTEPVLLSQGTDGYSEFDVTLSLDLQHINITVTSRSDPGLISKTTYSFANPHRPSQLQAE